MKPEVQQVKVGQVWADNDPRMEGRTLCVTRIYEDEASCRVLTPSSRHVVGQRSVGRNVRIALKRFRPTPNGYRLLSEATDG